MRHIPIKARPGFVMKKSEENDREGRSRVRLVKILLLLWLAGFIIALANRIYHLFFLE